MPPKPSDHKNTLAVKVLQVYSIRTPEYSETIVMTLGNHIEAMLYNIASIAAVTAMLDGKTKIETKHISFIKDYITKQCSKKKKKGVTHGGSFPSEYFGYNSEAYNSANYGGVNYTDSVWSGDDNAIRQAIPMSGGDSGSNRPKDIVEKNKHIFSYMKEVIAHNGVTISKPALNELVKIANIHLNCLGDDMSKYSVMKPSYMEKVLNKTQHSVFK